MSLPVVILISGRGTNLQAIIDQTARADFPVEIRAVISSHPDTEGLARARRAGLATRVVDYRSCPDRAAFDLILMQAIDSYAPQLVVLAGFMRILGPDFIRHYSGHLINIHPSLLPQFKGLDTHVRALRSGVRWHGASVHFVTPEVDGGPVIIQAPVAVLPDDSAETLAARVLEEEHRILPLAIRWFANGRLAIHNERVLLDGRQQADQGLCADSENTSALPGNAPDRSAL